MTFFYTEELDNARLLLKSVIFTISTIGHVKIKWVPKHLICLSGLIKTKHSSNNKKKKKNEQNETKHHKPLKSNLISLHLLYSQGLP